MFLRVSEDEAAGDNSRDRQNVSIMFLRVSEDEAAGDNSRDRQNLQ